MDDQPRVQADWRSKYTLPSNAILASKAVGMRDPGVNLT